MPNVAGTWKSLTDNVNSMANNLTSQVRSIAQVTTAVARGNLSQKIDVDARGEILELKTTINTMVDTLSSFAAEVTRVAREVGKDGRLGGQAEVEGVSGTWKRLTENVNELAGNLTRQVRAIAEVASAVATGDLTRSISVEAEGEVAELSDNINAMVQSLRETTLANEQQDWLNTNLARISGLLQGHRDLRAVAQLIMNELAPLVGAQHGTFFLMETGRDERADAPRLALIAGYGYETAADLPQAFELGESLIGQVARVKRPLHVEGVPPGYVRISSSLGSAPPISLIVLPIVFEDQVLGVIELASFYRFTPVQRDFLEQLTESIGVNLNTIIANARTDSLLDESQRLAAELQARSGELQSQQGKLQQSNAELEEKAALLVRQNRDIEIKNFEIEQARQEIEERAQQLALASRYKSEFLANMSHELRTPLTSLLILAGVLAQNSTQNLTPKQVEFAKVIQSAGTDLQQLIDDILDLSKVEAGKMDIHPEEIRLAELLDYVRTTFHPLTADKGLEFEVSVDPDVPELLTTDDQRLRQVLRNLLSNAVKFTEKGRVELRVRRVDGPEPRVALSVVDTGIGISKENLSTIFGAFQQADGTTSRRYGGTGLGLSISRQVANLLGGEIQAQSRLGRGSTFTLLLPVTPPFQVGAPERRTRVGAGRGEARARRRGARQPVADHADPPVRGRPARRRAGAHRLGHLPGRGDRAAVRARVPLRRGGREHAGRDDDDPVAAAGRRAARGAGAGAPDPQAEPGAAPADRGARGGPPGRAGVVAGRAARAVPRPADPDHRDERAGRRGRARGGDRPGAPARPQGPARRRRLAQRAGAGGDAEAARDRGQPRVERSQGDRRAAGEPAGRPDPDGRDDAGDGRLRHDGRHPRHAAVRQPADHHGHGEGHGRRPGEEPGLGRERLRHEAGRPGRAAELHRPLAGRRLTRLALSRRR